MTDEASQVTFFLNSLQRQFALYEIDEDIQHIVARSFLSKKAKLLLETFRPLWIGILWQVADCAERYKVTVSKHSENFETAYKYKSDTWIQYALRLQLLLQAHLRSRECDTFDKLVDLICSDKLEKSLDKDQLDFLKVYRMDHVGSNCNKIASMIDTFSENEVKN